MNNTPETTYFDAVQNYEDAARALRKSLPEPSSTYITQCITRETGFISLTIERLTGNGFGHYDATVLYKEDGAVKYVVVRLELAPPKKYQEKIEAALLLRYNANAAAKKGEVAS